MFTTRIWKVVDDIYHWTRATFKDTVVQVNQYQYRFFPNVDVPFVVFINF